MFGTLTPPGGHSPVTAKELSCSQLNYLNMTGLRICNVILQHLYASDAMNHIQRMSTLY